MADSPSSPPAPKRDQVLSVLRQGRRGNWVLRLVSLALLLCAVGAGAFYWLRSDAEPQAVRYKSVSVERGSIDETVTATGTLSPVDAVELGAEVTGKLTKVAVDVNDHVEKGQVLAEIDPDQLSARVKEARAQLQSALASQKSAKTSLNEAEVKQRRVQALFDRGLASSEELETVQAATARADASVAAANAQITVARASLSSAETALSRAIIVAPISGVVLSRNVEPGQTVTAGFQTPVLFTLARDLRELELNVEVDEADIGKVREGQHATFTVDAYPEQTFESQMVKLHNLPTASEGASAVVTYAAVLTVKNEQRLLRPGMTATATIKTRTLQDALLVPNVALRFEPPAPNSSRRGFLPIPGFGRRGGGRPGPAGGGPPGMGDEQRFDPNADRIFLDGGSGVRRVAVKVLGTDGVNSAVEPLKSDALTQGAKVIVDIAGEPAQ